MFLLYALAQPARWLLAGHTTLILENLALRQQLALYKRAQPRPRLRGLDRLFWALLARLWPSWRSALVIVQPETVIAWHRQGFRLFWRWKSRPGRQPITPEIRQLIRQMAAANPTWGAPHILSELRLLGYHLAQSTVARYLKEHRSDHPPSQGWLTFLKNHAPDIAACDFSTVPTATFKLLYGFVILLHDRRVVVHVHVTDQPSAAWAAQQIVEAFPWDTAPRYLVRDNDGIYGHDFQRRIAAMGIEEKPGPAATKCLIRLGLSA